MSYKTWDHAIAHTVTQLYETPLEADRYLATSLEDLYHDDWHALAWRATQELPAGIGPAEMVELLVRKQKDYGPNNIMQCPAGPHTGIVVRLYDKVARHKNITTNMVDPANETLVDTYMDIIGYIALDIMVANNYMELPLAEKVFENV